MNDTAHFRFELDDFHIEKIKVNIFECRLRGRQGAGVECASYIYPMELHQSILFTIVGRCDMHRKNINKWM